MHGLRVGERLGYGCLRASRIVWDWLVLWPAKKRLEINCGEATHDCAFTECPAASLAGVEQSNTHTHTPMYSVYKSRCRVAVALFRAGRIMPAGFPQW